MSIFEIPTASEPVSDQDILGGFGGRNKGPKLFSRVWLRWFDSLRRRNGELIDVDLVPFVDNVVPHNLKRTYENWFVMSEEDIPCDLLVQRQTALSITNNAYVNVNPDTVVYDEGGDYDGVTNFEFVAPAQGKYKSLVGVAFSGIGATGGITTGCAIFKNGVLLHDGPFRFGPDATAHSSWSTFALPSIRLNKNDTLRAMGWHDDTVSVTLPLVVNAFGSTRLSVSLIKEPITENKVDNTSKETQILLRTNYAHGATIWVF